ncbi:MAG: polymerase, partial [Burkholderiaceae bacterium]
FLLPAMFAFGIGLGERDATLAASVESGAARSVQRTRPLLLAAMLLLASGFAALYDYMGVVAIFAPPANAQPLAQRIVDGRHSWFFAHHANYAAATVVDHPSEVMAAFRSAPHYLLDARLMMAWAKALNEAGDVERARYVAQRLAEFHNPSAAEFFKPCKDVTRLDPGTALPFQCTPPSRAFRFEDFR